MTHQPDRAEQGFGGDRSPAVNAKDTCFIDFASACTEAVGSGDAQARVAELTRGFVQNWQMPDPRYLQCQPDAPYGSYLLYLSDAADLCIVLDIFMARQAAVVHNHLCWCVFSCLDGVEREYLYDVPDDLSAAPMMAQSRLRAPGQVTMADAARNAFHQVECAQGDQAISLHLYGADIGSLRRQMWVESDRAYVDFQSGYSNTLVGLPPYLSAVDLRAA